MESSPAELLFQCKMFTKIPSFTHTASSNSDAEVRIKDSTAKAKMKSHADSHRHTKPHTFTLGDTVLHRQHKQNKFTMPYNNKAYTVTQTKGSMVTAAKDGHTIVRNSSFFKKVAPELQDIPNNPDDGDYEYSDASTVARTPRYPKRNNRRPPIYLQDYK